MTEQEAIFFKEAGITPVDQKGEDKKNKKVKKAEEIIEENID
jgi:hypothetical protein